WPWPPSPWRSPWRSTSPPTASPRTLGSLELRPALHAEAVPVEVVVSAGAADQPPWRLRLHPAVPVPPVPDAVLRAQRPFAALAVEDAQLTHRGAKAAGIEPALLALLEELSVLQLGLPKRID